MLPALQWRWDPAASLQGLLAAVHLCGPAVDEQASTQPRSGAKRAELGTPACQAAPPGQPSAHLCTRQPNGGQQGVEEGHLRLVWAPGSL